MRNDEDLDLLSIIKYCNSKKIILITILVISMVIGVVYTFILNVPMYKSKSRVLIDKTDASIAEFVTSKEMLNQISNELNYTIKYGEKGLNIEFDRNTKILTIEDFSTNNDEAYNTVIKTQEILKRELEDTYGVRVYRNIEQATLSNSAYNVNHIKDLIMTLIIGIVICALYIIVSISIKGITINSIVNNTKLTVLGEIPKEKKEANVISYISTNSKAIDSFRRIIANIEFNKNDIEHNLVFVTSANNGEGTSYVTANMAMRYAKTGKKVLVIDANNKNSVQHKIFNVENENGLSDLISLANVSKNININEYIKETAVENISILTSGTIDMETELLFFERIKELITMLKENFDIIIIDGMSMIDNVEAIIWASLADISIITVDSSKTKLEDIVKVERNIKNINGKIAGVVINKVM